ncbi:MAG TPA: hypothetical protein VFV55_11360, partial [Usitatibacteraceae bacterium]|nr:hypothetical protein [Usitatibacteraceae bacterium]
KQVSVLRLAKRELGLSYPRLATTLGVSERTMEKWALDPSSGDHRGMPLMARKFLCHLLEEAKRRHLSAGDRDSAERIDAIAANADPARMRVSLQAFDALQRTANALAPMRARPDRPRFFRTLAEKNSWEDKEILENARRARAKSARRR